jgi:hypothetical protein
MAIRCACATLPCGERGQRACVGRWRERCAQEVRIFTAASSILLCLGGRVAIAPDCRSGLFGVRWFKSIPRHQGPAVGSTATAVARRGWGMKPPANANDNSNANRWVSPEVRCYLEQTQARENAAKPTGLPTRLPGASGVLGHPVGQECAGAALAGTSAGGVGTGDCCVASKRAALLIPAVRRALNTRPISSRTTQTPNNRDMLVRSLMHDEASKARGGCLKRRFTGTRSGSYVRGVTPPAALSMAHFREVGACDAALLSWQS